MLRTWMHLTSSRVRWVCAEQEGVCVHVYVCVFVLMCVCECMCMFMCQLHLCGSPDPI